MDGTNSFRLDGLAPHEKSTRHIACAEAKLAKERPKEEVAPVLKGLQCMEEKLRTGMIKLFHIAYFLAKAEKPLTDFPKQIALHRRLGGELPTCYNTDKACSR